MCLKLFLKFWLDCQHRVFLISTPIIKILNGIWPGSGSAVSSAIAAAGTSAIGKAAIAYYIDGKTMDEAKKKFEEARNSSESASR